jgi:hypothetical protein
MSIKKMEELPELPFPQKTKKYGLVTVTDYCRTDKGGLVEVDDGNHAAFWARSKDVFGFEMFR